MKNLYFTVYIEKDEDGVFVGSIPTISSCYAQGQTQEEMLKNLQEVLRLCLRNIFYTLNVLVGCQSYSVKYIS